LTHNSDWTPSILLAFTVLPNTSYNHFARTPPKTQSSVAQNARLPVCYLAIDVILLLSAYIAGICLPIRYLAMGIHVTIYVPSFINIGLGVQKLTVGDTQTHRQDGGLISLFFFSKEGMQAKSEFLKM
jgi:hypothetical protein